MPYGRSSGASFFSRSRNWQHQHAVHKIEQHAAPRDVEFRKPRVSRHRNDPRPTDSGWISPSVSQSSLWVESLIS